MAGVPAQPLKTPIVQKPAPIIQDQLLIEQEDSNSAPFDRNLEYGHRHNDQVKYPAHVLLKQGPNAYGVYQRVWGTTPVFEDTYNAAVNQEAESNAHPIFVRAYRVLRADYLVNGPATKLVAFTGLIAVKLTAGGTGYTKDFTVTFSGGAGSGATALAIVDGRGVVVRVELLNPGTGYTSAPTVIFSAGDGSSATGTAAIQPAAAVLVSEKHSKLQDDDPYSSLFDRVVKVYETLPGPAITTTRNDYDGEALTTTSQRMVLASITTTDAVALGIWTRQFKGEGDAVVAAQMTEARAVPGNYVPFTRYDDNLGPIQGRRRLVVNTSQAPTLTATGKITYEARADTDAVAYEVEETYSNGTGGVGNPAYPIGDKDFYDNPRGAVQQRSQLVVRTGSEVGSLVEAGGTVTLTQYEPFNEFLLRRVVETWAAPGVIVPEFRDNEDGTATTVTRTLKLTSAIAEGQSATSELWTGVTAERYSATLSWEVVATRPLPGNILRDPDRYDVKRGYISSTRQLVYNDAPAYSMGPFDETHYEKSDYGDEVLWKMVDEWVAIPTRTDDLFEDDRGAVERVHVLVSTSSVSGSLTVSGGNLATKITYEAYNAYLLDRTTETWAVPGPTLRNAERYDEKLGLIAGTRQLVENTGSPLQVQSASGHTRYDASAYGTALLWKIIESWSVTFPIRTNDPYEDERGAVQSVSQLITASSVAGSLAESGGTVTKITYEAFNEFLLDRTTETWTATGPARVGKAMAEDAQGAVSTVSRQLLVTGTATPTVDFKTLRYTDTPISAVQIERQTLIMPDAAFPILTEYDQDEETGALITTTYQVVEASAVSAPSFTVGQITRYRRIDKWRSLKIFTVFATPASYSEFRFAAHHFPSLLYDYEYIDDCGAIIFMRKGFSSFTDCRIDISFGSYDSSIAGLQIMPNSFRIFKFVVDEVLNDSDTLVITGDCAGTLPIAESEPDRTAYEALIGDFSLISGESVLWKAGRFRTTELYYRML